MYKPNDLIGVRKIWGMTVSVQTSQVHVSSNQTKK